MKKIFVVLVLAGAMASCKEKSKDAKTTEPATTTPNNNAPAATGTSPAPNSATTPANTAATETAVPPPASSKKGAAIEGVPTFADPEIQKFANEYTAFARTYKEAMANPAKSAAVAKAANEWSAKMGTIGMKLNNNPEETKKWEQWAKWISREMYAAGPSKKGS